MPAANAEAFAQPKPWTGCPECGTNQIAARYNNFSHGDSTLYGTALRNTDHGFHVRLTIPFNPGHLHFDTGYKYVSAANIFYCPQCGHIHRER